MSRTLPPEIVVTETADGVRYRLPRPQFGDARFVGCFLIPFGLLPAAMGGDFLAFAARVVPDLSWSAMVISCLLLLIPLGFLLGGLALIFFGAWRLGGHQEITLTPRHVRGALCVGPLRWWRRRPRARLKQFTVVRGNQAGPAARGTPEASGVVLLAECEGSQPLKLAVGFPEDWLQALADDLARKCRALPAEDAGEAVVAAVGVSEESASPHDIRDRPERPVNCLATLEETPAGAVVTVAPPGVWRGSPRFVVVWAFLWCAMLVPTTAALVPAALTGNVHDKHGQPVSPLRPMLFLVPFWLVGVGFLLGVLHRGRRRATLTVDGDRLIVVRSGLFGTRRWEWSRDDIAELRVVCDRRSKIGEGKGKNAYYPWQIDLRVVPREGAELNIFTYREGDPRKADLEWVATELRRALHISAEPRGL